MDKFSLKAEYKYLIIIAVATAAVFASSLWGNFVYDDTRQILENPLIQDSQLYGRALVSDVWAFKGDGSIAASNYWRPTFTALNIVCFKLFGAEPFGWHLVNVALHLCACLLAFGFFRRLGIAPLTACLASVIFAVHPVHTESVAWIAGSPDLLFGIGLLGSLILADWEFSRKSGKPSWPNIAASLLLFAFALGSKEVALLCLPLFYLLWRFRRDGGSDNTTAFRLVFGIGAITGAFYFAARWMILGEISRPAENGAGILQTALSAPSVFAFYLGQAFLPCRRATNYPLRAVQEIGFTNFVLPLTVVGPAIVLAVWLWRKGSHWPILIGIFALPLVPAFNLGAFIPEQIVHDRYLYLPLLGAATGFVILIENLAAKFAGERARLVLFASITIIAVSLGLKTISYSQVWNKDLSLWKHAVTVDDQSAFNWSQLGSVLSSSGATAESFQAYDRSISIAPTPIALMGRARGYIAAGRLDEAIRDAKIVTTTPLDQINAFTLLQGYETLGMAYDKAGDATAAEATFREGRRVLPIYAASLTEKLAVVLYVQGKKQEALNELIGVRDQAGREMLADSKVVYFRLGLLYSELANSSEARRNFQEFLAATENNRSPAIIGDRKQATAALARLK
ncbi:MAG: hypothetical protein IPJ55_13600 [Chloracidobacterium sp.]|nr:hypothetical protein [Chloracidobacterium sp.]